MVSTRREPGRARRLVGSAFSASVLLLATIVGVYIVAALVRLVQAALA